MRRLNLTILAVLAAAWSSNAIGENASVDYPSDYRSWQHVKSMIIQPGHEMEDSFKDIHHIYANSEAMRGLTSGQYDDGAVFVFDLLDYDESDKTIVETGRKFLDVMQYDSAKFSETGGWGYETFVGDSKTERLVQDVGDFCFGCHMLAEDTNYIFSQYRP